ncbi:MAG: hypothetical protein E7Z91_03025 [Cyanobacteria bacterium SIG30]|nr:hypothetical protein [Cyanobacteria bacterium SIG30]
MKKNLIALSLLLSLTISYGYCESTVFDSYTTDAQEIQKIDISPVKTNVGEKIEGNVAQTSQKMGQIQNENFEAAIQSLDAAQVEIRDELAQYTQKYNDAKARYDIAKEECKALKKQINAIKRKIKHIERTKNNISKNFVKYYE